MTAEEVVREGIDAYNSGDRARYEAVFVKDAVAKEAATGREIHGASAIGEMIFGWKTAFPDMVGETVNLFACGDQVTAEMIWRGTHTGPLVTPDGQTIPPTNRTLDNPGCLVFTLRDGKVVEQRHYFDLATLMRQLGLMPNGG